MIGAETQRPVRGVKLCRLDHPTIHIPSRSLQLYSGSNTGPRQGRSRNLVFFMKNYVVCI